jgi:hypothetical protein
MSVRDYNPDTDKADLERIHSEMGFDYRMPDLEQPLCLTKKVCLDENGRVIGACYTVLQAESYLLLDTDLSPAEKVAAIAEVDRAVTDDSYDKGINQLVAYLPPGVEEIFQRRLLQQGWLPGRPEWKLWTKELV